ncbi:MAG TPA: histidinol dehydrogenase [Clostridia bacterium]|nr:histidinol dehydrogenase [Clostridia bacterium]
MIKTKKYSDINLRMLRKSVNSILKNVSEQVGDIIENVCCRGDEALYEFTQKYDGADLRKTGLKVSLEEITAARKSVEPEFISSLHRAAENIRRYHERQKTFSWIDCDVEGLVWGRLVRPLSRVGIYVPGGTAAYPSSVLMNAIPAQVAGVKEIVMVSPPDKSGKLSPYSLAAAGELGITEIYKLGGAQAIAALAVGSESIKPVVKITGPGNIYVTAAKKLLYGEVDIDMLAGPSEIFIVASGVEYARYIAADMLSQAEHDVNSASILATPDAELAAAVKAELAVQLKGLPREEIARKSLMNNGLILITDTIQQAIEAANEYAPEHLEVIVEDPMSIVPRIEAAGSVFLGPYTPEPVGDYFGGTNHILPTGGTAVYASPLGVEDFIKSTSLISYSRERLLQSARDIELLAEIEGLEAHANAVRVRRERG